MQTQGSGSVLATERLDLLPSLAEAFPQYAPAHVSPLAVGAAEEAEEATGKLPLGAPAGQYLQHAAATEAAAALGLQVQWCLCERQPGCMDMPHYLLCRITCCPSCDLAVCSLSAKLQEALPRFPR